MSNWDRPLRLAEAARGPVSVRLEPDAAERAAVAKRLGLQSLTALRADLTIKPWLDGAEISGRFEAVVEQRCSISLDPFEQEVGGEIEVRVVPPESPHAPADTGGEVALDLETQDPPDVLADDSIPLAEYVVEHLALELDPFPRKPGVSFDYQPPAGDDSPFAVLKQLKDKKT